MMNNVSTVIAWLKVATYNLVQFYGNVKFVRKLNRFYISVSLNQYMVWEICFRIKIHMISLVEFSLGYVSFPFYRKLIFESKQFSQVLVSMFGLFSELKFHVLKLEWKDILMIVFRGYLLRGKLVQYHRIIYCLFLFVV